MANRDREIVSALQAALAEIIGKDRYELWFGDGVRLSLSENAVQVSAPDGFTLERLKTRLHGDLAGAVRAVLKRETAIEFQVDATLRGASQKAASLVSQAPAAPPAAQNGSAARSRRKFASLRSFVVGVNNRVAHTSAIAATENLGAVSPLFFHGPTGCGKTHLLEGVWSEVRRRHRSARCVYLSAEQFTSYFLEALRGAGLPMFRRKYRDVDVLLIDDVQFFEGKRATIVELQHTTDALLQDGGQLVLAADRPPAELRGIGPELAARFSGGLVCTVQPADRETRLEILQRMSAARKFTIPSRVLELIADELNGDARQLSGAVNRVHAVSKATGLPVTPDAARAALEDVLRATRRAVRLSDIDRAVCDLFGLEPENLKSNRRSKDVSYPRMLAMFLARRHTRAAYSEIGAFFGGRRHSTVISAQKKVTGWVATGAPIAIAHGSCKVEDALRRIEDKIRIA